MPSTARNTPAPVTVPAIKPVGPAQRVRLYRWARTARAIDTRERELTAAGDALFQLPCSGHEGAAALGLFLEDGDWVHPHYRDKAVLVARGLPIKRFFDSLLANADDPAHGRMMGCFHSSRELNLPSTVVPVGNHALQAVGIAHELRDQGDDKSIVLCGLGDGTTQQGEVLEAIAEAVRAKLPVLFYIEDNRYAISTQTAGQTFFDLPDGPADSFYGLPIQRFDAIDVVPHLDAIGKSVHAVRATRKPGLMLLRCERLTNHTNADDQRVYRTADDLAEAQKSRDVVAVMRRTLIEHGDLDAADLDKLDAEIDTQVHQAAEHARRVAEPPTTFSAKRDFPAELTRRENEYLGESVGKDADTSGGTRLTMIEAMRETLRHHLLNNPRVTLLGEDIEDPKGDVFGLTRGLSTAFPGRVRNTALAESTIVGTAIGRAMAGGRPVAFCQFADFLPNGINQVLSEMGTIRWRTGEQFECPVILMVTCGGYRAGLGPFHSQTLESILAHTPGIDVYLPSDAADAAGLLNAAFASQRPAVFLYPKTCLNDRARTTSTDVAKQLVPPGTARRLREGEDLTLVAWGSTVTIACDVADTIGEQTAKSCDVFDLRSIDPWDAEQLADSAKRTGRLLVVHEDNLTAGFGAEVVAEVAERVSAQGVNLRTKRVARFDTPIPQNFASQLEILPSFRRTLAGACELLGLELHFADEETLELGDSEILDIPGSSPADQVVSVTEWKCQPGDTVKTGDHLADLEADKAVFEYAAPMDGVIEEHLVPEGEQVDVGTPFLKMRRAVTKTADAPNETDVTSQAEAFDESALIVKRMTRENMGIPRIARPDALPEPRSTAENTQTTTTVYLSPIHITEGTRRLTNDDLIQRFPDRTADDIVKRTGIESRPMAGPNQTALSMAVDAASKALEAEGLTLDDLTGIVCHTTTPPLNTPSMACMVLNGLDEKRLAETPGLKPAQCTVYDVNAACSGWLYALDAAYNTVRDAPRSAVLVVTTETLSRVVNPKDFDTAILFGDAATATIVRGTVSSPVPPGGTGGGFQNQKSHHHGASDGIDPQAPSPNPSQREGSPTIPAGSLILTKPVLSGKADPQHILTVGFEGQGHIEMDGKKVFVEGVRAMTDMTTRAFAAVGRDVHDCDWLVPHQANRRIFEAVRKKLGVDEARVIDEIAHHGNTSSSSIPLSIAKRATDLEAGQTIGLCAFGGGFTFGAAILEVV